MMGSGYVTNPLIFLIQVAFELYILLVVLRFLLQLLKADFYNPLSQFTIKLTAPVLNPLRRLIPGIAGLDVASLILAWVLKTVELLVVFLHTNGSFQPLAAMLWAIPELLELFVNIFLFAIVIQVILSWVGTSGYNPASSVLDSLTEPVLAPLRRWIKPVSGFDLSPMAAVIGLIVLKMLLLPPVQAVVRALLI